MTRIFHSESLEIDKEIELDDFASQHLSRVMRVKIGDEVNVFNTHGEYAASIQSVTKKSVHVVLKQAIDNKKESDLNTTLLQAVTRRERMDYAIQKATELGVNTIQPIMTEHCVVKIDAKKVQNKLNHWHGIARHATEQCGRLHIPKILPVISFTEALKQSADSLKLIFTLNANKPIQDIKNANKRVVLALGPVGGFSKREVETAISHNFQSIKLGPRILRAETATVAALTAAQLLWGDLT